MDMIELYIALLAIIAVVGVIFRNSTIPTSLLLVIVGMILSFIPFFPPISINPKIVFNIFLPLLLYEASAYTTTWKEIKTNIRPIALLSIGHVIFITFLVAITIHYLIPEFGWPLSIVLGAVISPPDDVAILSIAEKIRMPIRVLAVLKGEAMLNDATALIIYRFALIAVITQQFSLMHSIDSFFAIIICETAYGFVLATMIGELRLKVRDPSLQMMISILTPFLAYLPASNLGGSGVIATVATGLFIGNFYWERYPPDVRLTARSIWTTLSYGVQSILFLLVGLDLKSSLEKNIYLSSQQLFLYCTAVLLVVVIGRFIWCFPAAYLPRMLFPAIKKKEPHLPWQYIFIISWAGMRGGISLAAALAVPALAVVHGIDPRNLLILLVFSVIIGTLLLQGLSLPWILNLIGLPVYGDRELKHEKHAELVTRAAMIAAVLKWLSEYEAQVKNDAALLQEIKLRINEYSLIEQRLRSRLYQHKESNLPDADAATKDKIYLLSQIIEIEREELLKFWRDNKLSQAMKYKLEQQLDLRAKHLDDLT